MNIKEKLIEQKQLIIFLTLIGSGIGMYYEFPNPFKLLLIALIVVSVVLINQQEPRQIVKTSESPFEWVIE